MSQFDCELLFIFAVDVHIIIYMRPLSDSREICCVVVTRRTFDKYSNAAVMELPSDICLHLFILFYLQIILLIEKSHH